MFVALALICGFPSASGCAAFIERDPLKTEDACWEVHAEATVELNKTMPPGFFIADQQCVNVAVKKESHLVPDQSLPVTEVTNLE